MWVVLRSEVEASTTVVLVDQVDRIASAHLGIHRLYVEEVKVLVYLNDVRFQSKLLVLFSVCIDENTTLFAFFENHRAVV